MRNYLRIAALLALALTALNPQLSTALAQGTAFTYQGRLNTNGSPADGIYDLRFAIYDAPSGGTQQGNSQTNSATGVTNGLFTVTLDFGPVFTGAPRWLDLAVRPSGNGTFTGLTPRQDLTPAPYAVFAESSSNLLGALPAGQLSGAVPNANLPASPSFSGTVSASSFVGSGAGMTGVNAAALGGLSAGQFWQLGGNSVSPAQFLGSTNNQPVEIWVNGMRGMRLEPTATDIAHSNIVNIVNGSSANFVAPGVYGAVIGGGGATVYTGTGYSNSVLADFGVVGGGANNSIQANATSSFLGGGAGNAIQTSAYFSVLGGGIHVYIETNAYESFLGGGNYNFILPNAFESVLVGGFNNSIQSFAFLSFVGGGEANTIGPSADHGTIGGGLNNQVLGYESTIAGGYHNTVAATDAAIGGGDFNTIQSGGYQSFIGGGLSNTNLGILATIPGGDLNVATNYAFAAGNRAKAVHQGAFVWADSQAADFASTTNDQFDVRAQGGAVFVTSGAGLTVDGLPVVTSGAGSGLTILQNTNGAPDIIGGSSANQVSPGVVGATIGGGGAVNYSGGSFTNSVTGDFGTVGGGIGNAANNFAATVGGGRANTAAALASIVGGGFGNTASGIDSTVSGGSENVAGATGATIGGGVQNTNSGSHSTLGGGRLNVITYGDATVAGGNGNVAKGIGVAMGGGVENTAAGDNATVGGGYRNTAGGNGAFVGGGGYDGSSFQGNQALGNASVIGGGLGNSNQASLSFVGSGYQNNIQPGNAAVIGGGYQNLIQSNSFEATIAGGWTNVIGTNAYQATIGGGAANSILPNAQGATIPGGSANKAGGIFSFAAGQQAQALHQGAFVWADSQNAAFASTANDQFLIRAQGGIGIGTNNPAAQLHISTTGNISAPQLRLDQMVNGEYARLRFKATTNGIWDVAVGGGPANLMNFFAGSPNGLPGTNVLTLNPNGNATLWGTLAQGSDRARKENFQAIDPQTVLAKVNALPISAWNYKTEQGVQHLGPMAQDFYASFALGADDKHITTVDEGGVALAAIQGLNEKVEAGSRMSEVRSQNSEVRMQHLEEENAQLRRENEGLGRRLDNLEKRVQHQTSN